MSAALSSFSAELTTTLQLPTLLPIAESRDTHHYYMPDDEIDDVLELIAAASDIYGNRNEGTARVIDAQNKLVAGLIAIRGREQCQYQLRHVLPVAHTAARVVAARPVLVHDRDAVWDERYAGVLVSTTVAWRVTQALLELYKRHTGLPPYKDELLAWLSTPAALAAIATTGDDHA